MGFPHKMASAAGIELTASHGRADTLTPSNATTFECFRTDNTLASRAKSTSAAVDCSPVNTLTAHVDAIGVSPLPPPLPTRSATKTFPNSPLPIILIGMSLVRETRRGSSTFIRLLSSSPPEGTGVLWLKSGLCGRDPPSSCGPCWPLCDDSACVPARPGPALCDRRPLARDLHERGVTITKDSGDGRLPRPCC